MIEYVSEQQQICAESSAKYKILKGVAGSRKTDTLVKAAILYMQREQRDILVLTLVGSVTNEITTRFAAMLHIKFTRINTSNHYIGIYHYNHKPITICVSNYDAWVHRMLVLADQHDYLRENGNYFSHKIKHLTNLIKADNNYINPNNPDDISLSDPIDCKTYYGSSAGLLIIDEIQDFSTDKINLVIVLAKRSPDLHITIAGDYLQTIFECTGADSHPMNIFNKLKPKVFDMSICFRCPKAHIDFNNYILRDVHPKYPVTPMQSHNNDTINKPYLFAHGQTSLHTAANNIAKYITTVIDIIMAHDHDITPGDIAVIMGKTNDNKVYQHLNTQLSHYYQSKGHNDCVMYMNTSGNGVHHTIDWTAAAGKTVLLSIHGDKGRGHKVVFLLGVTENSIPRDFQVHKPDILIAESLINVATTRSTRYLFIGFNHDQPSRYLAMASKQISEYAYCGWDMTTIFPKLYDNIRKATVARFNISPTFGKVIDKVKREKPTHGGDIVALNCTTISTSFEHIQDFLDYMPDNTINIFGKTQHLRQTLPFDSYVIMGHMAEILIQRNINRNQLFHTFERLRDNNNIIYSSDERILSIMYDAYRNNWNLTDFVKLQSDKAYIRYFKHNADIIAPIRQYICDNTIVLHEIFNCDNFRKHLEVFLSDVPNDTLRGACVWNIALCYSQYVLFNFIPAIHTWYGLVYDKINEIHYNVNKFVDIMKSRDNLSYNINYLISNMLSSEQAKSLGYDDKPRTVSLRGAYDIYDNTNHILYEIKSSTSRELPHSWIIQAYLYAMILAVYNQPVHTIVIMNAMTGVLYTFNIDKLPELGNIIANNIGPQYRWHDIEIDCIISKIYDIIADMKS